MHVADEREKPDGSDHSNGGVVIKAGQRDGDAEFVEGDAERLNSLQSFSIHFA